MSRNLTKWTLVIFIFVTSLAGQIHAQTPKEYDCDQWVEQMTANNKTCQPVFTHEADCRADISRTLAASLQKVEDCWNRNPKKRRLDPTNCPAEKKANKRVYQITEGGSIFPAAGVKLGLKNCKLTVAEDKLVAKCREERKRLDDLKAACYPLATIDDMTSPDLKNDYFLKEAINQRLADDREKWMIPPGDRFKEVVLPNNIRVKDYAEDIKAKNKLKKFYDAETVKEQVRAERAQAASDREKAVAAEAARDKARDLEDAENSRAQEKAEEAERLKEEEKAALEEAERKTGFSENDPDAKPAK